MQSETSTRQSHNLIASDRVEGTPVRRSDGEKIGTIERLMIDKISGNVAYAVLSFGGFLGLGQKHAPIPWAKLSYDPTLAAYHLDRPLYEQYVRYLDRLAHFDLGPSYRTKDFSGTIGHKFPFFLYRNADDYYSAGGQQGSAALRPGARRSDPSDHRHGHGSEEGREVFGLVTEGPQRIDLEDHGGAGSLRLLDRPPDVGGLRRVDDAGDLHHVHAGGGA